MTALFLTACAEDSSEPQTNDSNQAEETNEDITVVEEQKVQNEAVTPALPANLVAATVTRVVDGDTIVANVNGKDEKVRLILVDTPETKHPSKPVQPFGPEASDFTTEQLEGKEVKLQLGIQDRDQYGRMLAYVFLGDKLFNQILLEKGLARVAVYPPNTEYVDEFRAVQETARQKEIGIWSIENYATDRGFNTEATPVTPVKSTQQPKQNNSNASCESQIKGSKSGIYHTPGSKHYNQTTNVIEWFCTEKEAQDAGYRAPKG